MNNDELINLVITEIDRGEGQDSDELAANRKKALDYYYNRQRGDEEPGVSDIQSSDVADMINAVLSQMVPAFCGDTIVNFEPETEEDEPNAQLESDVVSDCIIHRNNGYTLFMSAIKNALLQRNGFIRVDVDETERAEEQDISDLTQEQANMVASEYEDAEIQGDTLKIMRKRRKVSVVNVDPAKVIYTRDWDSPFLDGIPFFAEQQLLTRSQLVELGLDAKIAADFKAYTAESKADTNARSQFGSTDLERTDDSQDLINTYVCYILADTDGDGIAEQRRIHIAYDDKHIINDDPAGFIPYATGTAFVTPNRLLGESLADHLFSIQDSKTHFMRQWHENAKRANKPGTIAANGANIEDLLNPRTNGIYREKVPGLIRERMFTDTGPSMQQALDYLDKVRTERGGASLDMIDGTMQIAGDTAHGIERQYSSKEQMAAMMTRSLGETLIRQTYLLVHNTYREYFAGEKVKARIGRKWVETDPGQWPEREQVNIKVGMSVGERGRRDAAIQQVMAMQKELIMSGYSGVLTDAKKYHNAVMDWCRAAELDAPEQYFIDPATEEAKQAAQANQQAQEQQNSQLMQMQDKINMLEAQKERAELQFKYFELYMKGEIEEAKIIGSALNGLETAQAKAESAAQAS